MGIFETDIIDHLTKVTNSRVELISSSDTVVPIYFSKLYTLKTIQIGELSFIAIFLLNPSEFKPIQFLKQVAQVLNISKDEFCIITQHLPTYVRKRLIEKGVSFIIPKEQIFMPMLGVDFRYKARKNRSTKTINKLSPVSQVVFIGWLMQKVHQKITPSELAKLYSYSAMSMSRAVDELESIGLITVSRKGKTRQVIFSLDKKQLWQKALPYLQNPIRQKHRVLTKDIAHLKLLYTGHSALANSSHLTEPTSPELAISSKQWKVLKDNDIEIIPIEEPETTLLEVWSYNPELIATDHQVDPYSNILSFSDNKDERIEMAVDEMMKKEGIYD